MEQQALEDEQSTSNNASMPQSNLAEIGCETSTGTRITILFIQSES